MMLDYLPYLLVAVIAVVFLTSAIRILREYQRGVIFTLGRFTGVKGPGLIILVPFVQQMVKVDLWASNQPRLKWCCPSSCVHGHSRAPMSGQPNIGSIGAR